jgi:hypothetical protein
VFCSDLGQKLLSEGCSKWMVIALVVLENVLKVVGVCL